MSNCPIEHAKGGSRLCDLCGSYVKRNVCKKAAKMLSLVAGTKHFVKQHVHKQAAKALSLLNQQKVVMPLFNSC